MGLVEGKTAVVTGGGSGIGAATCRRLAEHGARVAVLDIDAGRADAVAHEIDGFAFAVDVCDGDALQRVVEEVADRGGGISVLFNNAGGSNLRPLHEYPTDEWQRIVALNLSAVFFGIKAVAPIMLAGDGGAIVSTASISGTRPAAGEAPYAAAKAAVAALTATAALEYAPTVRVNAVSPGMIHTAMTDLLLTERGLGEADAMAAKTPLDRVGTPDDVADVVLFLCSDMARFVTGQNLVVDGGMTLHGSGVDGLLDKVRPFVSPG